MRDGERATLRQLFFEQRNHRTAGTQHIAEPRGDEMSVGCGVTLGVYLGHTLGGTHHVGGIHRLVGGDHHKFLNPVTDGGVGHVFGAENVHTNSLVGILLHKRHVLVGGSVIDYVWRIFVKHLPYPQLVANIGYDESYILVGK